MDNFNSPRARLVQAMSATGIALFALACATPTTAMGPSPQGPNPALQPLTYGGGPILVTRHPGRWARYRLGYTALTYELPGVPEVLHVARENDIEIARLALDNRRVQYNLRSFRHESIALADVNQLMANAITEHARRAGGVPRTRQPITVGGYPGVDLTFQFPNDAESARVRLLVGRTRSYAAILSYPTVAGTTLTEDFEHFLASLALDVGDAPEEDGDGRLSSETHYVEPVGALFAIRMPGRPRRTTTTFATPRGSSPVASYTVEGPNGGERWNVSVTAFEGRPPEGLFAQTVSALTSSSWTVREEREINTQGYPGREYVLASSDGRSTTRARLFVTSSRLYDVRVTHPAAPDAARDVRVNLYFDSLRIL